VAERNANGFITLDRTILQWRWYTVPSTAHLFVYLILRANHEDRDFMGITVHRGELISSLKHISEDTGLSINQVRTAIKHLISTSEITSTSTNRYTLISIVNYDLYQSVTTNKSTNRSQTKHKQITNRSQQTTTNNNVTTKNHENNVCVTPTLADAVAYFSERKRSEADAGKFYNYNQARGWKIGKNKIMDWHSAADMWIAEQQDVSAGNIQQEQPMDKEYE